MFCRDAQVDKVCVVVEKVLKDVRSRARERGDYYRGQRELMLVVKFHFFVKLRVCGGSAPLHLTQELIAAARDEQELGYPQH